MTRWEAWIGNLKQRNRGYVYTFMSKHDWLYRNLYPIFLALFFLCITLFYLYGYQNGQEDQKEKFRIEQMKLDSLKQQYDAK